MSLEYMSLSIISIVYMCILLECFIILMICAVHIQCTYVAYVVRTFGGNFSLVG